MEVVRQQARVCIVRTRQQILIILINGFIVARQMGIGMQKTQIVKMQQRGGKAKMIVLSLEEL